MSKIGLFTFIRSPDSDISKRVAIWPFWILKVHLWWSGYTVCKVGELCSSNAGVEEGCRRKTEADNVVFTCLFSSVIRAVYIHGWIEITAWRHQLTASPHRLWWASMRRTWAVWRAAAATSVDTRSPATNCWLRPRLIATHSVVSFSSPTLTSSLRHRPGCSVRPATRATGRSADCRNTVSSTAGSWLPPTRRAHDHRSIQETSPAERPCRRRARTSDVLSATKRTRRRALSRCTFARTLCRADVDCAARRSRDRGCCKVTWERTRARSRSPVHTASERSLTGPICERTCRRTTTSNSTTATSVDVRSRACLCCWNTATAHAQSSPTPETARPVCMLSKRWTLRRSEHVLGTGTVFDELTQSETSGDMMTMMIAVGTLK